MNSDLLSEYIRRRLSITDLESELMGLIKKHNQIRSPIANHNIFAIAYVAAFNKPIPTIGIGSGRLLYHS